MSAFLLEAQDISVHFGGVRALDGVSLGVAEGELVGLIGPNGAGKTTLLKVITGVLRPRSGRILLSGADVTRLPTHARVRRGLGLTHQIVRPFHSMAVRDNVILAAGLGRTAHPLAALLQVGRAVETRRAMDILERLGLSVAERQRPGEMPLGQLKRLEAARALALEPKILLLDEPLAGLNDHEARRLADTIVELNRSGITVVLVEHNLSEVLRVSRRLVVLDNGRVLAAGAPREVIADPAVREAYVGPGRGGHAAA
ncbi:MAG: ABC transporter ATP-binding protein [Rhodospirillaceae bacterium]|jgi:branched-chain amino acid transport system ATP-binding protein|nr:ABC transporter ATP-binding protein [Rhodospirillaceae bacterium]